MRTVGIVIPCYNGERYLSEAVMSATSQTISPKEVIIVNDGSTDGTPDVARRLEMEFPAVRVIDRDNGGQAAARNVGLYSLKTDYVIFLDADDRLHSNAVQSHLRAFEDDLDAVMVFGGNLVIDESGKILGRNIPAYEVVTTRDFALGVGPCPSQCMYLREAVIRVGGFNEWIKRSNEIDLNFRVSRYGRVVSYGDVVMDYRRHPGNLTRDFVSTFRNHLTTLERHFGSASAHSDAKLLRDARLTLYARYGGRAHGGIRAALGAMRHGRAVESILRFKLIVLGIYATQLGRNWPPHRRSRALE